MRSTPSGSYVCRLSGQPSILVDHSVGQLDGRKARLALVTGQSTQAALVPPGTHQYLAARAVPELRLNTQPRPWCRWHRRCGQCRRSRRQHQQRRPKRPPQAASQPIAVLHGALAHPLRAQHHKIRSARLHDRCLCPRRQPLPSKPEDHIPPRFADCSHRAVGRGEWFSRYIG